MLCNDIHSKYQSICNYRYYIENCNVHYELTKVDSVNDLGVRFDSKLDFSNHMNDKVNKAYSILGVIKKFFY